MIMNLSEIDKITLQNIMLSLALEKEKQNNLNIQIQISQKEVQDQNQKLEQWKNKINKKLNKLGTDITQVDVNGETGTITLANVRELVAGG